MSPQVLVANKKYIGKYVAMKSFTDRTVVASGKDHDGVVDRAQKKGIMFPVVIFVPEKDMIHIY